MIRTVDAEQGRTLAMLQKWVDQNSGTMNLAGVASVGRMVRSELEPLGFKVAWIDMKAAGRAGHIVARHAGKGKRLGVLLLHDDKEREYAYGPATGLPETKVGTFTQALYDEAKKRGWTVISMKNDWKRVFAFAP